MALGSRVYPGHRRAGNWFQSSARFTAAEPSHQLKPQLRCLRLWLKYQLPSAQYRLAQKKGQVTVLLFCSLPTGHLRMALDWPQPGSPVVW
ncbi:hypothetical protein TREES_T100015926 [Tupaia chinensis]|uniref:Uncharacterized protein n=1 Tax=Tupaia chinensis TaxID=246437 RepID=L9KX19_TUPCH|nr:hypothetical protein TREES_T100015926 [Tupaia chinensis]